MHTYVFDICMDLWNPILSGYNPLLSLLILILSWLRFGCANTFNLTLIFMSCRATHSSTLAWKLPRTKEPGGLQSMGSLRVGHDWATSLSLSCIGEGYGNPLQCSCLENPRDGGAWWAAVCGVAQSRTRLTWLSSSSSSSRRLVFMILGALPNSSTRYWRLKLYLVALFLIKLFFSINARLQSMGSRRVGHNWALTFHFHALEKEMATHSSVLAWRIPGTGEPGGLPSLGLQSQTRLKRQQQQQHYLFTNDFSVVSTYTHIYLERGTAFVIQLASGTETLELIMSLREIIT